ncbi:MAG: ATP-binding protein [Patescibacteria group bacterium]|nr:ATP-binding protein [Patescibacteria group bacterium]
MSERIVEEEASFGAYGIIEAFLKSPLTFRQCLNELIDNSLDAHADDIKITIVDGMLTYKDNGFGCDEPSRFVGIGKQNSEIAKGTGRSAHFGEGLKAALIKLSQANLCTITSVAGGVKRGIRLDWKYMQHVGRLVYSRVSDKPACDEIGTTIIVNDCIKLSNFDKLVSDIGFDYAHVIRGGVRIKISFNGRQRVAQAYEPPRFAERIDTEFECNGCKIRGYAGLVLEGEPNPHHGITVRWGPHKRALLLKFNDPADGVSLWRVASEIELPTEWKNFTLTKDSFAEKPHDLCDMVAEEFRPIFEKAEQAGESFEINSFSDLVAESMNATYEPFKRIKGRRPGITGKSGTTNPTGTGSPHKEFATYQPGDKADRPKRDTRIPKCFRIHWRDDMTAAWMIEINGNKLVVANIYLNKLSPRINGFRERNDIESLATFCFGQLAQHISKTPDAQARFQFASDAEVADIFAQLTGETLTPKPSHEFAVAG